MKNAIQDIALAGLIAWSTAIELVLPSPDKRAAIKDATADLKHAKEQHKQLVTLHTEERNNLRDKYCDMRRSLQVQEKLELNEMLIRQKDVKSAADDALKAVRQDVVARILGTTSRAKYPASAEPATDLPLIDASMV